MAKKENSEEIYNKARQVISGGVSRNTVFRMPYPNYANSASGCYITDIDGTVRTDFANNMAALIHGHSFPPIIDAVIEQLKKGTAYTLASEIEVAFATHLIERVQSFERIRFMNSGTEAVMAMIKASRAFTGRPKIAKPRVLIMELTILPRSVKWQIRRIGEMKIGPAVLRLLTEHRQA